MKYFLLRTFYRLFRKSDVMEIKFESEPRKGKTYTMLNNNKYMYAGNNYFIKL